MDLRVVLAIGVASSLLGVGILVFFLRRVRLLEEPSNMSRGRYVVRLCVGSSIAFLILGLLVAGFESLTHDQRGPVIHKSEWGQQRHANDSHLQQLYRGALLPIAIAGPIVLWFSGRNAAVQGIGLGLLVGSLFAILTG